MQTQGSASQLSKLQIREVADLPEIIRLGLQTPSPRLFPLTILPPQQGSRLFTKILVNGCFYYEECSEIEEKSEK